MTTWVTAAAVLRQQTVLRSHLKRRPHGLLLRRYWDFGCKFLDSFRKLTTWVTAAAVLRPNSGLLIIFDKDHMGYCCGGIETFSCIQLIFKKSDHMGYCCGGIETRPAWCGHQQFWPHGLLLRRYWDTDLFLFLYPIDLTTWVTAAAVLRLNLILYVIW